MFSWLRKKREQKRSTMPTNSASSYDYSTDLLNPANPISPLNLIHFTSPDVYEAPPNDHGSHSHDHGCSSDHSSSFDSGGSDYSGGDCGGGFDGGCSFGD